MSDESPQCICGGCGRWTDRVTVRPGSDLIALWFWFFLIIPGLFYYLWRQIGTKVVCMHCGSQDLVPRHSPRGAELLEKFGHREIVREAPPDPVRLRQILDQHKAKQAGTP